VAIHPIIIRSTKTSFYIFIVFIFLWLYFTFSIPFYYNFRMSLTLQASDQWLSVLHSTRTVFKHFCYIFSSLFFYFFPFVYIILFVQVRPCRPVSSGCPSSVVGSNSRIILPSSSPLANHRLQTNQYSSTYHTATAGNFTDLASVNNGSAYF